MFSILPFPSLPERNQSLSIFRIMQDGIPISNVYLIIVFQTNSNWHIEEN